MLTFIAYVILQVKFITDPVYELHYTPNKKKSFCAYILKHVTIPGNVDGGHWWKTKVRPCIMATLSRLRNSNADAIKWTYFGKYKFV